MIGLSTASVDLREKPCKAVELWKVVAHHKLIKSRVIDSRDSIVPLLSMVE